jgi:hypothetical protein
VSTPKTFGVLGPLIQFEHYPADSRIAATEYEYTVYMCRLAKERPDFAEWLFRLFMNGERPTEH